MPADGIRPPDVQHLNYIITINSVRVYVTGALISQLYSLEEVYARDLAAYYAALQTHPHHNYYEGRAGADLTGWLTYFLQSMVQEFERVADEVRTYAETPPVTEPPELQRWIVALALSWACLCSTRR